MRFTAYIVLCLATFSVYAQQSSLVVKKLNVKRGDCVVLDSTVIDPSTIEFSKPIDSKAYTILGSTFCWKAEKDSFIISFRKLNVKTVYQNKDPDLVETVLQQNPFDYIPPNERVSNKYGSLHTAGNISRGLGFGNAQDIVVNSNLNLRINGTLANEIEVLGVISDENNPIQPEGNTQQIQDFDQIYITLRKDSTQLTVGDFLMNTSSNDYFMKYYKKSRGIQVQNVTELKKWKLKSDLDAAISRGRFSRNEIEGIEGNSGPYRLSGSNGEIFIIVIAGTEVVYLDGKRLTRGEDHDYVINYNTGEITFTPKVLITRYSRIVVEFQYSDRNYARSVFHTGSGISNGSWTIYGNFYNEMDLKNQPFQQSLDAIDSNSNTSAVQLLSQSGDNNAIIANVRPRTSYNTDRIMYRRIDSMGTQIYVYSDNPEQDTIFYEVVFSNVGIGNGSYVQIQSAANGKVFEYRGPGMGDYDPIDILIAPRRFNMMNIGANFEKDNLSYGLEFAMSGLDKNTFSNLDEADNIGYGLKAYRKNTKLIKDSSQWKLHSLYDLEIISRDFNYVERYRSVEFNRAWNKTLVNPSALSDIAKSLEAIGNVEIGFSKSDTRYYSTSISSYQRPGNYEAYRTFSEVKEQLFKFLKTGGSFEALSTQLQIDSAKSSNEFRSTNVFVELPFKWSTLGSTFKEEQSSFRNNGQDSLLGNSYGYNQFELFIRNPSSSKIRYSLSGVQRKDRLPKQEGFSTSTIGRDLNGSISYISKSSDRIALTTTYRNLTIEDTALSNKPKENTLQSRIEFDYKFMKKLFRTKTFYQIGTNQEQRREFQYLQVQNGNGVYIWNDYDSNNIKTLNEFEIASDFDRSRADYIKIYVPVPGFIATRSNKISETFEINPVVLTKAKKGKTSFIGRFYSLTSLILEKKTLPGELTEFLNPFARNISDTSTINSSQKLRTTLFFNRTDPTYGLDYTYINNSSKVLLTNGFDSRVAIEHALNSRINIKKSWTINTKLRYGSSAFESQFFTFRNFDYGFYEINPKLQYQYKNKFRIELITGYFVANNIEEYGGENTENLELGTSFKFTKAGKGSFDSNISYVKVKFDGNSNSTLGYDLLRGLQDGNNATWKLSYQQKLANSIQIVLSYDGRKSQDAPVIHIGNLVARYLF